MQLRQIERISNLILGGITLITLFVITLLYCIWIRDRKKNSVFFEFGLHKEKYIFSNIYGIRINIVCFSYYGIAFKWANNKCSYGTV